MGAVEVGLFECQKVGVPVGAALVCAWAGLVVADRVVEADGHAAGLCCNL